MSSPDYRFHSAWRLQASPREVYEALQDPTQLPRWWPAVYLEARELCPAAHPDGRGRRVALWTKGWLPYTLRWDLEVVEVRADGFALDASGDLHGRGDFRILPSQSGTMVLFDWRVRADKPLLRALTPWLRDVFAANHAWAMRTGEESLRLELRRRRAVTLAELVAVPSPPRPTFRSMLGA
jgi:hypothetical protein